MSTIRVEGGETTALSQVYVWLSQHRGQVVELGGSKRLALGVPISGARAVIVAADVEDGSRSGPRLGGVLRALSHVERKDPVRLVFDVRSTGGLDASTVEQVGSEVLQSVAALIADSEPAAKVA